MSEEDFKQAANLIGTLVGRGRFGPTLEGGIKFLRNLGLMGAPRLFFSQVAIQPRLIRALGNKHLRALAARQLGLYYGVRIGILQLLQIAAEAFDWELEIEWNPLDKDFGLIRIGKKRINVWGATRSLARTLIAIGQIPFKDKPKFGELSFEDRVMRLATNRMSPSLRLWSGLFTGRDWMNRPVSRWTNLADGFIPLTGQDVRDVIKNGDGIGAVGLTGGLSFFGLPTNIYETKETKRGSSASPFGRPKITGREGLRGYWNYYEKQPKSIERGLYAH